MSLSMLTRLSVSAILLGWSVLSYGFVRGAMEQVLPGPGDVIAAVIMSMLLMVPMLFLTPLWFLSRLTEQVRGRRRRSRGACAACGHVLDSRSDQRCPECGSDQVADPVEIRRLVKSCVLVWVCASLIGSAITEVIARLDEHSFIRMHEMSSFHPESRSRAWPLMGSLEWDEATRTAKGSFLGGRYSFLDLNPGRD